MWRDGLTLHVRAATTFKRTRCPFCGRRSRRVQSFYQRTIADLACAGGGVTIHLRVRRFWCRVRRCRRKIFCERLPELVAAWARKTPRLRAHLRQDVLAMGGERGARHATAAGLPVSARTLLRLVRTTPLPAVRVVRALGVDAWARRKGRDYGTILVDLEAHRVLDLLPERTSATLAAWLGGHPEIEVVSRDRAMAYPEGIWVDYAAVAAGLTLDWSQGQVEGQVNRLKETKRVMYGRANFDLLRLGVLHPV